MYAELTNTDSTRKEKGIDCLTEVYGLSTDVPSPDGNLVMGATTKGRWSYACSKAIDEFLALLTGEKETTNSCHELFVPLTSANGSIWNGHPDLCYKRWQAGQ